MLVMALFLFRVPLKGDILTLATGAVLLRLGHDGPRAGHVLLPF